MSAVPLARTAWAHRPAARPLRAWRASQLDALALVFASALRPWAQQWGTQAQGVRCTEAGPAAFAEAEWEMLGTRDGCGAWIAAGPALASRQSEAWFGTDAPSTPVVLSVLAACRQDLLACLRAGLGLDAAGSASSPDVSAPWNGAVVAELPCGASVLLEGELLASMLTPTAPKTHEADALTSLAAATGRLAIDLQVGLQPCEVEAGELQDLRCGDILRLGHALDAPVRVTDAEGALVFHGWLARSGRRLSIELAATGEQASRSTP